MVSTRSQADQHNQSANSPVEPNLNVIQQLTSIASRLQTLDALAADVAALKSQRSDGQPGGSGRSKEKESQAGFHERTRVPWGDIADEEMQPGWPQNFTRRPYAKVDFPKFDGGDPRGWILKAEKYFRYYQVPDNQKVEIASMSLEGEALDVFAWMNGEESILYWEELVKLLQENFGLAEFQNPDEYLCNIRQSGSIQEYRQEFSRRVSRVHDWPEHCLLGVFINGLKEDLKADVRIHKPRTVYQAMSLALQFESKLGPNKGLSKPPYLSNNRPGQSTPLTQHRDTKAATLSPQGGYTTTAGHSATAASVTANRSWESERQLRRDKGLCFRCNEKFGPGHRCKTPTFSLLELTDSREEVKQEEVGSELSGEENLHDMAEISFHAILGKSTGATMKLRGSLLNRQVLILIDSGSTHNFISTSLVEELGIKEEGVSTFGVEIENGDVIRCNKICRDVSVTLPGLKITQDYFPFSLGGADVVLGIKWLASLNTVQANWKEMFMIFYLNGKRYKLQGIPSTSKQEISDIENLIVAPISKASARQRAGRAGRVRPGKCFRLYTEECFINEMPSQGIPEIQRSNLVSCIIQLKALGIDNILGFDWPASPSPEAMIRALEILYSLEVLDDDAKLTSPTGFQVAEIPMDPMISKMILASSASGCSEEIITISAVLSVQSIWISLRGVQKEMDEAKSRFAAAEDLLTKQTIHKGHESAGLYILDTSITKGL
ncbi:unnamed protein product [Cuscuta europaea]|uniref:RNA helicase n=1 Tax=Cuscuta europaea TaxID=41803 RepID=A0A9P0ZRC2_CUSEU|nr:unnamed protein product [Cuscuta europaea]